MSGESASEENLRDLALRLCMEDERKRRLDTDESRERSVVIVGCKSVGKTTMVHRFLEKEELVKPTIALDYSFGRKAGKSLAKSVCHIWEVGQSASSLIAAALSGAVATHSPRRATILLAVDLARPEVLWTALEESVAALRSAVRMSLAPETIEEMTRWRREERRRRCEEVEEIFPMRMCIVGGKYDEFKEFDLDRKEVVGKALRAIAHSLGAGLYYHSSKEKSLAKRSKEFLSHYAFGTPFEGKCTDYEKPLLILPDTDSYALIDPQLQQSKPTAVLDTVKRIYVSRIPQATRTDGPVLEDPSNDPNFSEVFVDRLKAQREEEISVLLQDMLEGRTPQIPIPDPF